MFMSLQKLQIHFVPFSTNFTNGLMYARHSLHLTIGLPEKLLSAIGSPDGNSPNGFTTIANGIPQSLASCLLFGNLSVVTLNNDLSEFNSSSGSPSNGACVAEFYC